MPTIEERLLALEKRYDVLCGYHKVPGTQLCRLLKKEGRGVEWGLGIGGAMEPKIFFYGDTIEEVLSAAEKNLETQPDEGAKLGAALCGIEEDTDDTDWKKKIGIKNKKGTY